MRMTDAQRAVYGQEEVGWHRARTMAGITQALYREFQQKLPKK